MKNKQYENSKIRYKLKEAMEKGKKDVHWRLTHEQEIYVRECLHMQIEPEIFRIRTRKVRGEYCEFPKIIKLVHNKNKYTETFSMPLNKREQEILTRFNIKFWPEKFKIFLSY